MTTLADLEKYVLVAPKSDIPTVNALLDSGSWIFLTPSPGNTLYYSFSISEGTNAAASTMTAFNDSQQSAARQILAHAAGVTGIQFVETANGTNADIHFAAKNISGATTAGICERESDYSYSGNTVSTYNQDAYVFLDNVEFLSENQSPTAGSGGYETLLHEVGHALGLKHPFETDSETSGTLDATLDNTNNTVMSYTQAGDYKTTFQAYDLAALDYLYGGDGLGGTNYATATTTPTTTDTATDTGQVDTTMVATISGTDGNDKLTSDATADWIEGLAGNDQIRGGGGEDRLVGGEGSDKLSGGSEADAFVFDNLATGGSDKILDFSVADGDTLVFDAGIFDQLPATVTAGNLVTGAKAVAKEEDDYLLFATKGGKLYYDADGDGSGKAILLAGIKGSLTGIDHTSFVLEEVVIQ